MSASKSRRGEYGTAAAAGKVDVGASKSPRGEHGAADATKIAQEAGEAASE